MSNDDFIFFYFLFFLCTRYKDLRRDYLEVVEVAVCGGRDVQLGDVEHDLLAVGRQDPPLALVALLEGARVHARGRRVERRVLRRPELGAGVLKHDI